MREWQPSPLVRRILASRPGVTWCYYCDAPLAVSPDDAIIAPWGAVFVRPGLLPPTADHLLPRSRGGSHAVENLVLACVSCNSRKGTRAFDELPLGFGIAV